jgi:transcriptional regulator with XRE-family HTH domain
MAEQRGVLMPNLRAWRRDRGLTQGELAQVSGVAISTITRAENEQPVSLRNARKLAAALKLEYRQLLHEEPDVKADPAA